MLVRFEAETRSGLKGVVAPVQVFENEGAGVGKLLVHSLQHFRIVLDADQVHHAGLPL